MIDLLEPLHSEGIQDHVVLMPFLAGEMVDRVPKEANTVISQFPGLAADIFAFMHWVGDEDRSLLDIMLVGDHLVMIDNGLC